jgi:hypothetical protein
MIYAILIVAVSVVVLPAQVTHQQDHGTAIRGFVRDPTTAVISEAKVTVTPIHSDRPSSTVQSDRDGRFTVNVMPGSYSVCAQARGFVQNCKNVSIQTNETESCDLMLQVVPQPERPSSKVLDDALRKVADPDAVNCGHVHVLESSKQASSCVLEEFRRGHAFFVRYDLPGVDSEVAAGLAGNSNHLSEFEYDSFGISREGWRGSPRFQFDDRLVSVDCPSPTKLRRMKSGRVSCFERSKDPIFSLEDDGKFGDRPRVPN